MSIRRTKWHHRLLGTADDRRAVRDVWLRRLGLARSRTPMELVRRRDLTPPNLLRGLAAELLLTQGELSFVQVGAFDGASDDDLTSLLAFGHVRGVLVEPQPEPFDQLQRRYRDMPNVQLANCAIAREAGVRSFYCLRNGSSRLASFDRKNLILHGVPAGEIVSQPVPCKPLDQLLDELQVPRLDVLQIDAEGYDLEVLATLDLNRWQPRIIRFEFNHLPPLRVDECIAQLAEQGYQFLVQQRDLVASLPMPKDVSLTKSQVA